MAKKTRAAHLERDIQQALASKPKKRVIDPLLAKLRERRREGHGKMLRAIRKAPVAIVMTNRYGSETLAIITPEMSRPSEGAWRASIYWHDGPVGHITRKTLGLIARELDETYAPKSIRAVDDDAVMAWTNTEKFSEGVRKVAEVQAWNEGRQ